MRLLVPGEEAEGHDVSDDLPRPTFEEIDEATRHRKQGELGTWIRSLAGLGSRPQADHLKRACPRCGAPPNQMCTNHLGRRLTVGVHDVRKDENPEEKVAQPVPGAWPVPRKS
jgi:hypothetical protein